MRVVVRRLGSARLESALVAEPPGWVAVPGPLGEEAASVLADESRCYGSEHMPAVPARPLTVAEQERLAELWERAVTAARLLPGSIAGTIVGVRPSLTGGLVVEVDALPADWSVAKERELAAVLAQPVRLVAVGAQSLYGGLGRPLRGEDSAEAAMARLLVGGPALPGGYPRIGARVETPRGLGTVMSVRTRDRTALVQVGDELVRFSIDQLRLGERSR